MKKGHKTKEYTDIRVVDGTTIVKDGDITITINVGKHWWFYKNKIDALTLRVFYPRKEQNEKRT
jgi:hypothetical protein